MSKAIRLKDNTYWDGTICETGSNDNGNYIKFANGIMICYATKTTSTVESSGAYSYGTWTYPVSFAEKPVVFATANNWTGYGTMTKVLSTASGSLFMSTSIDLSTAKAISRTDNVNLLAIGKWK